MEPQLMQFWYNQSLCLYQSSTVDKRKYSLSTIFFLAVTLVELMEASIDIL